MATKVRDGLKPQSVNNWCRHSVAGRRIFRPEDQNNQMELYTQCYQAFIHDS